MKKGWIITIVIVVAIVLYGFGTYNGLVTKREAISGQQAQVESQYQRRFDLIPNLVASVKGVMKQEQAVFLALADARTKYGSVSGVSEKAAAAGEVESALSRLLVVMENYPQLKSSETVQTLMGQIEGSENRVAVERMRFNDMVKAYNLDTKRFPTNILASIFGFSPEAYFESATGAENAPKVEL